MKPPAAFYGCFLWQWVAKPLSCHRKPQSNENHKGFRFLVYLIKTPRGMLAITHTFCGGVLMSRAKKFLLWVIVIVFAAALWSGLAFLHVNRDDSPIQVIPFTLAEFCVEVFSCTCPMYDDPLRPAVIFETWKNKTQVESTFKFCLLDVMDCSCSKPASEWRSD